MKRFLSFFRPKPNCVRVNIDHVHEPRPVGLGDQFWSDVDRTRNLLAGQPNVAGLQDLSDGQLSIMDKIVSHLKEKGEITVRDCWRLGTADGRKVFTELRRKNLLYPANDERGYRWEENTLKNGRHKVHLLKREAC